jgi:hypothetical protein
MRAYIKKLQSKKEETRKQIFAGAMISSMSIVAIIWVYSLGVRFGSPEIKVQANEDIKPFKLFTNSISDTYKNISASVGNSPSVKVETSEVPQKDEKQIDLIPVEYTNQ